MCVYSGETKQGRALCAFQGLALHSALHALGEDPSALLEWLRKLRGTYTGTSTRICMSVQYLDGGSVVCSHSRQVPGPHLSSRVEPMSPCPWRWWMAFLAPWGLSRWAMAVPGLFSKIFTYSRMNTHTEREGKRFISKLYTSRGCQTWSFCIEVQHCSEECPTVTQTGTNCCVSINFFTTMITTHVRT